MQKHIIKKFSFLTLALLTIFLSACDFFDKDNTPAPKPLVEFSPEIQPRLLWSTSAGSGSSGEYLKIGPAITDTTIFTSSVNGRVNAIDKMTGRRQWQMNTGVSITTSPAAGDDIVVVGSRDGNIVALQQKDGAIRWKMVVPGEILAPPAIRNNIVVVKTIDGFVRGLSTINGHEVWSYQQTEPSLILRGASAPIIKDSDVFVGFANGTLSKFSLRDGQLLWTEIIALPQGAFSIQRMIDIDANPIIFEHRIYAATFQGKVASLDWSTGKTLWSRDISSYTGMIADNNNVYISDARSHVWSFNANSGDTNWRQSNLDSRIVSGPALMNNYVVVGDGQGYLHWLSKQDGHFVGRVKVGKPVYATPIVDNNVLYALTSNGKLFAYTLS